MTVIKHKFVGEQYYKWRTFTKDVFLLIVAHIWLATCLNWLNHVDWMSIYLLSKLEFKELRGYLHKCLCDRVEKKSNKVCSYLRAETRVIRTSGVYAFLRKERYVTRMC